MSIIAKIYPNGEASLWFERRKSLRDLCPPPGHQCDRQQDYIDIAKEVGYMEALATRASAVGASCPLRLVTAPISTKKPERRSGSSGLTRHGARILRNAAYLIEKEAGKDQVTFATATLPDLSDEELQYVCTNWSEVVHRFVKRIRYQLAQKNLPSEVIHVTEVQPKRSQNEGREIPHIHLVFQGRKRKQSWAITPKQITKWWKAALQLPYRTTRTFSSSCQLARVKYSVSRYLSKYVAKTATRTDGATCSSTSRRLSLKQWWGCTDSLRKRIFRSTRVLSDSRTERLWSSHEKKDGSIWEYQGTIDHPWDGGIIVFCRFGRLTPAAKESYTRPHLGGGETLIA